MGAVVEARLDNWYGFAARVENLRPAWAEARDEFTDIMARQFDTQGGYLSGGWAPTKPGYSAWKVSQGYDARILHMTREMRGTFTRPSYFASGDKWMEVGSDSPIAKYHQYGTRFMVARPIIVLARLIEELNLDEIVLDYLMGRRG